MLNEHNQMIIAINVFTNSALGLISIPNTTWDISVDVFIGMIPLARVLFAIGICFLSITWNLDSKLEMALVHPEDFRLFDVSLEVSILVVGMF